MHKWGEVHSHSLYLKLVTQGTGARMTGKNSEDKWGWENLKGHRLTQIGTVTYITMALWAPTCEVSLWERKKKKFSFKMSLINKITNYTRTDNSKTEI